MRARRTLLWGLGACVALAFVAWLVADRIAVDMIAAAPSPDRVHVEPPADVGSVISIERPDATIRAWVFEPVGEARGTVICLHGIRDSKLSQVPTARRLARLGLRAVVVDSRGHGESTGRWLSYGVHESRDLVALVDALDQRGNLTAPLVVVGSSYGAATAIQLGAIEPRVRGVVAIAPFASLREVVREYQRWVLGPVAAIVPERRIDDVIDQAGAQGGFDPDDACPRCAAAQLEAPLLLVHGRDDERIPWQHSAAIRDAARGPAELRVIDGMGHIGIGALPAVARAVDAFVLAAIDRSETPRVAPAP